MPRLRSIPPLAFVMAFTLLVSAEAEPWTFERAIAHAMANNPGARVAHHRITAAQAALQQARAAFWPSVQFQSSYTRTDNPMQVFGAALNQRAFSPGLDFNNVPAADNLNVNGVAILPLYAGGRNTARRDAAQAGADAARFNAEAIRHQLGFEVARAFHTVLKTREFVRATRAAVESWEANLETAHRRLEGGALLRSEVLDIEVRLAQGREDFIRAENAAALAERALQMLLGIEHGEFVVAEESPRQEVPEARQSEERPEITAARLGAEAARAEVRGAQSGYRPRVSAFGSLDYDRGWEFRGSGRSYTAGVLLQWDIWDGRLTRAKVEGARAELETAREQERQTRLAIGFELEQARLALRDANARLAVTSRMVAHAEESAALTRNRFEQGLSLAAQLLDSENALVTARVRRAEAEADQQIAIAALRQALGWPQHP
jgi:outer membrane protein TolC